MEKFSKRFMNINKISKNILKYGILVSLIGLIFAVFLLKSASDVNSLVVAQSFTKGCIKAFGEVVLGAICMDVFIGKSEE